MSRLPEREAARRLAEVLDGAEPGDADVATVARVLRDAAAAARFDVAGAEIEAALERARPRSATPAEVAAPHRRRRPGRRASSWPSPSCSPCPFTSGPADVEVQARALAALGGGGQVLSVAEEIRPGPGESFPTSVRTGWIDANGDRQRWTQSVDGTIVAETLVDHGRVTRYDPAAGTAVIATSCAALASGCADSVDPVAFYRRALQAAGPLRTAARTIDGHRVFRVVLPVQRLADAVRIVQVATIDADDLSAAQDRLARDLGRRPRAHLRRDRHPRRDAPGGRQPRSGPARPRAAAGHEDHPARPAGRPSPAPRPGAADARPGAGARPPAVVARAHVRAATG